MWCGRKNCLSKAEYAVAMAEKRNGKDKTEATNETGTKRISKDFRIALAALTTPEDFASLEEQFFSGKE